MATLLDQLNNLDVLTSSLMGGIAVQLQPITGDVPVVQVSIEGRDELPIFITCSDMQIICLCYLWNDTDVRPERICRARALDGRHPLQLPEPQASLQARAGAAAPYHER